MPKDMGYGMKSSQSADKSGGYGASGRSYATPPFKKNPKQKDAKVATSGYRNTTKPGDPGNKGY